jgi:hypothetical protein
MDNSLPYVILCISSKRSEQNSWPLYNISWKSHVILCIVKTTEGGICQNVFAHAEHSIFTRFRIFNHCLRTNFKILWLLSTELENILSDKMILLNDCFIMPGENSLFSLCLCTILRNGWTKALAKLTVHVLP